MSQQGIKASEQAIQNSSFDPDYGLTQVETMGFDGVGFRANLSDQLAIKVTESGGSTYIGFAAVGTAEATAKWQAFKVTSTGTVTYADGDASFNNVATDLTALSYS